MITKPLPRHDVCQTGQMAEMREWHSTVLEAHSVYEGHGLCFMTFDEEHYRIALLQPPVELERRNAASCGMHHTAYTFEHLDAPLTRYSNLEAKGIEPVAPVQHGVTTSLYYPDGNFIESQVDNFSTPEETTGDMEGAEYGHEPVAAVGGRPQHFGRVR